MHVKKGTRRASCGLKSCIFFNRSGSADSRNSSRGRNDQRPSSGTSSASSGSSSHAGPSNQNRSSYHQGRNSSYGPQGQQQQRRSVTFAPTHSALRQPQQQQQQHGNRNATPNNHQPQTNARAQVNNFHAQPYHPGVPKLEIGSKDAVNIDNLPSPFDFLHLNSVTTVDPAAITSPVDASIDRIKKPVLPHGITVFCRAGMHTRDVADFLQATTLLDSGATAVSAVRRPIFIYIVVLSLLSLLPPFGPEISMVSAP